MKPKKAEVDELIEFLKALHGENKFSELEAEAKKLVKYLEDLMSRGNFRIRTKGPPSKHVGRVIADAVLQAGHDFENTVRKRVENIRDNYPEAATVSGFLHLIQNKGTQEVIDWTDNDDYGETSGVKGRLLASAKFFRKNGIETFSQLRDWLKNEGNRDSLLTKNGSGIDKIRDKTADYYRVLVGLWDAVAVDKFMRKRLLDKVGIDSKKYRYKEKRAIYQLAAILMAERPLDLDHSIYHYSRALQGGTGQCGVK